MKRYEYKYLGRKIIIFAENKAGATLLYNERVKDINKIPTKKEEQEAEKEARKEARRQEAKAKIEAIEWKALRHLWERELGGATSLTNEEYIEVLTSMKQFRDDSNKDE